MLGGEGGGAAGVIGVLMGQHHGGDLARRDPGATQPARQVAWTEAGIHQHGRASRAHHERVAAAAAAQAHYAHETLPFERATAEGAEDAEAREGDSDYEP